MTQRSEFVLNNLSQEQLDALDADYPDMETLESMLRKSVDESGASIALRLDKDGAPIAFLNQGQYACSGRSSVLFDALVIVLYKHHIADYDLASVATNTPSKSRRG